MNVTAKICMIVQELVKGHCNAFGCLRTMIGSHVDTSIKKFHYSAGA